MSSPPSPSPAESTTESPSREAIHYDLSDMQPWREYAVVLHNDEVHSYEQVIHQLIKALQCSLARAYMLTDEVHHHEKATVAIAPRERAFRIAAILRQIELRVTLRQLN